MNRPSTLDEARGELEAFIHAMEGLSNGSYEEISSLLYDQHDVPGALAAVIRSQGQQGKSYDDSERYTLIAKVGRTKLKGVVADRPGSAPGVRINSQRLDFAFPSRKSAYPYPSTRPARMLIFHSREVFTASLGDIHLFDGFYDDIKGWRLPYSYSATHIQHSFDMINRDTQAAEELDEDMMQKGAAIAQLVPNLGETGDIMPAFQAVVTDLSQLVLKATA